MFPYLERFQRVGARDLGALQDALQELMQRDPGSPRHSLIRTIEPILARGVAFSLLEGEPPFGEPLSEVRKNDDILHNVFASFAAITLLYKHFGSPNSDNSEILDVPPIALDKVFRWIDFMHPMHGYIRGLYLPDGGLSEVTPVCSILGSILYCGRPYVARFVDQHQPRIITLVLDLWLAYPAYMRGKTRHVSSAQFISEAILGLFHILLPRATQSSPLLTAELTRLVGGHLSRVPRCIDAQTRLMLRAGTAVEGSTWNVHFGAARRVLVYGDLSGVRIGRDLLESVIYGARACLQNSDVAQSRVAAYTAVNLLTDIMVDPRHMRHTVRVLDEGIIGYMLDHCVAMQNDGGIRRLARHLQDSFWCPSVLRAFRRGCDSMALPGALSNISQKYANLGALVNRFDLYWELYTAFCEEKAWKRVSWCHASCENRDYEVKPCACGDVFYCSVECQRAHWVAEHRYTCTYRTTGVLRSDGALKVEDVIFLGHCAKAAIDRHADWLGDELIARARAEPGMQFCVRVDFTSEDLRETELGWSADVQQPREALPDDPMTSRDAYGCRISMWSVESPVVDIPDPTYKHQIAVEASITVGTKRFTQVLPFAHELTRAHVEDDEALEEASVARS
ncbi:hypothetical protein K525DRAFT_266926 [Schizophyllum commune Loenen D]|nr:hypothetical protein K525DRAFT_266926 [Schizophyllum commune Loenen D]